MRRNVIQVMASILGVCVDDAARYSDILYSTRISSSVLKKYLQFLMDKGLLRYDSDTRVYRATEKGARFLKLLREVQEYIE